MCVSSTSESTSYASSSRRQCPDPKFPPLVAIHLPESRLLSTSCKSKSVARWEHGEDRRTAVQVKLAEKEVAVTKEVWQSEYCADVHVLRASVCSYIANLCRDYEL